MYDLVTTLGGGYAAKIVWEIALRRWDIENCIFHDLKTHWHLKHCYHHEQQALHNLYLLYCLAFNLFMLVFVRQLRSTEQERNTYIALVLPFTHKVCLANTVTGHRKIPLVRSH